MPITQRHNRTYTGVPHGEPEVLFSADSPPSSSDRLFTPDEDDIDDSDSISEKSWGSLSDIYSEHHDVEPNMSGNNGHDQGDSQPPDYEAATSTSRTFSNIDVEAQTPSNTGTEDNGSWENLSFRERLAFCLMLTAIAFSSWTMYNVFVALFSSFSAEKGVPATQVANIVTSYDAVEGGDVDSWLRQFGIDVLAAARDEVPVMGFEAVPIEPAVSAEPIVEEKAEEEKEPIVEEKTEEEKEPIVEEKTEEEKEPIVEEKTEEEKEPVVEEKTEEEKEPVVEEKAEGEKEPAAEEKAEGEKEPAAEEKAEEEKEPAAQEKAEEEKEPAAEEKESVGEEKPEGEKEPVVETPVGEESAVEEKAEGEKEPAAEDIQEGEKEPVVEEKTDEEKAPVEEEPEGSNEPVVEEPVVEEPVVEEAVVEEAVVEEPVGQEPVVEEPVVEEPVVEVPVVEEPVVEVPVVEEPVGQEPAGQEPPVVEEAVVVEEKSEEPKPAEEVTVQVPEEEKIEKEIAMESKQVEFAVAQVVDEHWQTMPQEEFVEKSNEDENAQKSNGGTILGAVAAGVSWIFNGVKSILGRIFGH